VKKWLQWMEISWIEIKWLAKKESYWKTKKISSIMLSIIIYHRLVEEKNKIRIMKLIIWKSFINKQTSTLELPYKTIIVKEREYQILWNNISLATNNKLSGKFMLKVLCLLLQREIINRFLKYLNLMDRWVIEITIKIIMD
jgi:hypothetical protein